MRGVLIDSYRAGNKVVLWIKSENQNHRIETDWKSIIYVDISAKNILKQKRFLHRLVERKTYLDETKKVYEVILRNISSYEQTIANLEKAFSHRTMLYNADIAPEQSFLYHHKISPGQEIEIVESKDFSPLKITTFGFNTKISLLECTMDLEMYKDTLKSITINKNIIEGVEEEILKEFVERFNRCDPDVIRMEYAFSKIPLLDQKLSEYKIESPFHRWDKSPIKYKGNKTFYSYGRVILRDFAVRLKGRILIDTSSVVGHECSIDAIMELCALTGARLQQVASRSFGAVFQQSLVRLMYERDILIPFKEKPVDVPISMLDMLAGDSGGHRFDPKVGYHENVAEIDFSSMFPWIIYNKNISADTMLIKKEPMEKVPRLGIFISHDHKGLIPLAIKPLLDKRMEYKNNPTAENTRRASGIKHVLVTAYGYARFREFKLGTASSHMAICSYAREIILESARLAEEKGFTVIHGVVDSLFLKKKGMTKEEVISFIKELEALFQMPISFEGMFKWIVFLPSINDYYRPLPSTYYGVFKDGEIKARGIEMRQHGKPTIVRHFQKTIIEEFTKCSSKKEILKNIPQYAKNIREIIEQINTYKKEWLTHKVMLSKLEYKNNNVQKQIIRQLQKKGITPLAGQTLFYILSEKGPIIPDDYNGKPDVPHYRKLLEKALFNMIQPFGFTLQDIREFALTERQTKIAEYMENKILNKEVQSVANVQNVPVIMHT
jgi:DNA polymerase-2